MSLDEKVNPAIAAALKNLTGLINNRYTVREYSDFQNAYDYFNEDLFDGKLPAILVVLQRKPKMLGHYTPHRYEHRSEINVIDEIALNPDGFIVKSDEEILSILVHEMVHVWQQRFGKPGRRGYHNAEWANRMKQIGLHPSDTGQPGGKERGEKMSHYIVKGGPFQLACKALFALSFKLGWQSHYVSGESDKPKKIFRVKFICVHCKLNAWAKPGALLLCGRCYAEASEKDNLPVMREWG